MKNFFTNLKLIHLAIMFITATTTLLSACATPPSGPKFSFEAPSTTKAMLYFYRPEGDLGTTRSPYVLVNGKPAFEAKYMGYVKFELEPLHYKIKIKGMDMGSPEVEFDAEANKAYFLRYASRGADDLNYKYTGPVTEEMKNSKNNSGNPNDSSRSKIKISDYAVMGLTSKVDDRLFFISESVGKEEIKDMNLIE